MPAEAVVAVVAFVGMFLAWVVVPSYLRKHHDARAKAEEVSADQT